MATIRGTQNSVSDFSSEWIVIKDTGELLGPVMKCAFFFSWYLKHAFYNKCLLKQCLFSIIWGILPMSNPSDCLCCTESHTYIKGLPLYFWYLEISILNLNIILENGQYLFSIWILLFFYIPKPIKWKKIKYHYDLCVLLTYLFFSEYYSPQ